MLFAMIIVGMAHDNHTINESGHLGVNEFIHFEKKMACDTRFS